MYRFELNQTYINRGSTLPSFMRMFNLFIFLFYSAQANLSDYPYLLLMKTKRHNCITA